MIELISKSKPQYKANLHCHSTLSDGKLTPQQLKEVYRTHGYSILAITDHETPYDHTQMTDDNFMMLTGYEAYIRRQPKIDPFGPEVHLNLFAKEHDNLKMVCYNQEYCKYIPEEQHMALDRVGSEETRHYDREYIQRFIDTAVANGYLVSYNHPCWSLEEFEDIMAYRNCFSMEMCNYNSFAKNRYEHNEWLYDAMLRRGMRIFCHGGDDNHNIKPLDSYLSDSFGAFTMIYPEQFNYPSVIEALEKGNFYASMGPRIDYLAIDSKAKKAHIEATGGVQLIMHCGSKRPGCITNEGNLITCGDFNIPDEAKYLRFTVLDDKNRTADTRGYFRSEWDR
ncbi:MAG: hypothetical protein VB035_11245 [Candidatus Fimivivens sp.]|nr:hypothetical protein [Candidatus Fimivivens sp.]